MGSKNLREAPAADLFDDEIRPTRAPQRRRLSASDLDYEDGPRPARARPARRRAAAPLWRRLGGRFAERPVTSLFIAIFGSVMMGVLVNALALQRERHPAPIFTAPAAGDKDALRDMLRQSAIPLPAPRPAVAALPEAAPVKPERTVGGADARVDMKAEAKVKEPARDPIAQLLKTGYAPAPTAAPAAEVKPRADILAAQRALMKLGYVLRPDGLITPATKQAVEIFERAHKMPVKGEMSAKVMKEILAAAE